MSEDRLAFINFLESVYCNNPECTFMKSIALKKDIEKQQCLICDSKLERRLCTVTVNFKFGDGMCKWCATESIAAAHICLSI